MHTEDYYMKAAFQEAEKAFLEDEVPVGVVIVFDDKIISRAYNCTEKLRDATAHAEMLAITAASDAVGAKYLKGCTLFVTLEPCLMCVGALDLCQISKVVYAAKDEKNGFLSREFDVKINFDFEQSQFYCKESSELLRKFFQNKR